MVRNLVLGSMVAVGLLVGGQSLAQAGGPGHGYVGGGYGGGGHHHHHHHGGGYIPARPIVYAPPVYRPVFVGNVGPVYPAPYGYGGGGYGYGGGYGCNHSYGGYYGSGISIRTPGFGLYYNR